MENQRIRLSKRMLKGALLQLLKEKSIEKITVYELCDTAQINRTTFYKYYGSQYDLLDDIENDFFSELGDHLLAVNQSEYDGLIQVLEYLNADQSKCKVLINSIADQDFAEKLFQLPFIRALLKNYTPEQYTPKQEEYFRLFFCHGGYAIIRRWLNEEDHESPRELAEVLISFGDRFRRK